MTCRKSGSGLDLLLLPRAIATWCKTSRCSGCANLSPPTAETPTWARHYVDRCRRCESGCRCGGPVFWRQLSSCRRPRGAAHRILGRSARRALSVVVPLLPAPRKELARLGGWSLPVPLDEGSNLLLDFPPPVPLRSCFLPRPCCLPATATVLIPSRA